MLNYYCHWFDFKIHVVFDSLPYRQVWQLVSKAAALYILPKSFKSNFWIFLKSRKANSLTIFPKDHSTPCLKGLIDLLSINCSFVKFLLEKGQINSSLIGHAGSPYRTYLFSSLNLTCSMSWLNKFVSRRILAPCLTPLNDPIRIVTIPSRTHDWL